MHSFIRGSMQGTLALGLAVALMAGVSQAQGFDAPVPPLPQSFQVYDHASTSSTTATNLTVTLSPCYKDSAGNLVLQASLSGDICGQKLPPNVRDATNPFRTQNIIPCPGLSPLMLAWTTNVGGVSKIVSIVVDVLFGRGEEDAGVIFDEDAQTTTPLFESHPGRGKSG